MGALAVRSICQNAKTSSEAVSAPTPIQASICLRSSRRDAFNLQLSLSLQDKSEMQP